MSIRTDFKENKWVVSAFWLTVIVFLGICAYFMIHNAYWRIGDEAIVIAHTGMGKPFSPLGFDAMLGYGRLYPFAYNLYNILLLFHDGYISPTDHYILQSVALVIYALAFVAIALFLLKGQPVVWKYAITFCFMAVCVARVYSEFITCYTGVWIVFMFLPVFLWSVCKFDETEKWGYGVVALLAINYISYCYETVFVIPLSMGACSLLFNYKKLSKNKRLINGLLVASGLLFLALYAIIVLPRVVHFYGHHSSDSRFLIAWKMFIAQKIYWIALVVLVIRVVEVLKMKSDYTIYDSMLLASFAYFCGAVVLKLDYTYYYNIGSLTAFVAILHFFKERLKPQWIAVLMFCLAVFYCRKMPSLIKMIQKIRVETFTDVSNLSRFVGKEKIYWYAPQYADSEAFDVVMRCTNQARLETYLSWLLHQEVHIEERVAYDENDKGIWLFPLENKELFPDDKTYKTVHGVPMFSARDIIGFYVQ